MRAVDRRLVQAATQRPGWAVRHEGVLVFKRPAAVQERHRPLVAEVRADRGRFVVWLRMRGSFPAMLGGSFTTMDATALGRGPVTAETTEDAFATAERWYDRVCREGGCTEHAGGDG